MDLASYQAIIACSAAGAGCGIRPHSLLTALRASRDIKQHQLPAKLRGNRKHRI